MYPDFCFCSAGNDTKNPSGLIMRLEGNTILHHPLCKQKPAAPVSVQVRDDDAGRAPRMDDLIPSDIHADVADRPIAIVAARRKKEHQVAGLKIGFVHRAAYIRLLNG